MRRLSYIYNQMLYLKDFDQLPSTAVRIRQQFVSEGTNRDNYSDEYGSHYLVLRYDHISHPQIIDELHSKGVFSTARAP